MLRRHVRLLAILVVAVLVLVAVAFRFRFSPLWPGPALPAGATRLHIATEDAHVVPTFGCPTALLLPGRVATEGDDLVLVSHSHLKTFSVATNEYAGNGKKRPSTPPS